jgi:hypothetical protein
MRCGYGIALALVLAAACTPTDSGIEGYVTAGPACPVMQENVPCPDQPYAGTLTILAGNGRIKVGDVTADASGYYTVALAPGTYIVHPESPGPLPRGPEVVVVVIAGRFTRQDIVYDTGIR